MPYGAYRCTDVVIANGQTTSNNLGVQVTDAESIIIFTPATLSTTTYTPQITYDGTTFVPIWGGSANITFDQTMTSRAFPLDIRGARGFRIVASGAVGSAHTFVITKHAST